MSASNLAGYYAERANEYDAVYRKPERQDDIKRLAAHLADLLAQRTVLEVACGTGYWTQFFAPGAAAVTATDCNQEVLAIAKNRLAIQENVQLRQADAFLLADVGEGFDAGFAGFWWSHVERARIHAFLRSLHGRLKPGSRVVFADNLYVEGNSTPISKTDADGNTYQIRRLSDGRQFEVLKNFPNEQEFRRYVECYGENVQFKEFAYFWCGWYDVAGARSK